MRTSGQVVDFADEVVRDAHLDVVYLGPLLDHGEGREGDLLGDLVEGEVCVDEGDVEEGLGEVLLPLVLLLEVEGGLEVLERLLEVEEEEGILAGLEVELGEQEVVVDLEVAQALLEVP